MQRAKIRYRERNGATWATGKRAAMWDGCGWGRFWHDKAGRTWKERRTIDGHAYETQWTYDGMDRVYQMTYPDGEVLTYSYEKIGVTANSISTSRLRCPPCPRQGPLLYW